MNFDNIDTVGTLNNAAGLVGSLAFSFIFPEELRTTYRCVATMVYLCSNPIKIKDSTTAPRMHKTNSRAAMGASLTSRFKRKPQ